VSQAAEAKSVVGKIAHPNRSDSDRSLFAALCGYIKLELLKGVTQLNHFALKSKLYVRALQTAFAALADLQPVHLAV